MAREERQALRLASDVPLSFRPGRLACNADHAL